MNKTFLKNRLLESFIACFFILACVFALPRISAVGLLDCTIPNNNPLCNPTQTITTTITTGNTTNFTNYWTTDTNQSGLKGDKIGKYNLYTQGYITSSYFPENFIASFGTSQGAGYFLDDNSNTVILSDNNRALYTQGYNLMEGNLNVSYGIFGGGNIYADNFIGNNINLTSKGNITNINYLCNSTGNCFTLTELNTTQTSSMNYTNLALTNQSNNYSSGLTQDFSNNNLSTSGYIKVQASNNNGGLYVNTSGLDNNQLTLDTSDANRYMGMYFREQGAIKGQMCYDKNYNTFSLITNVAGAFFGFSGGLVSNGQDFKVYNTGINSGSGGSRVAIGQNLLTPTAQLHISASDGGANTAPIKLTNGTLLTTPENGSIEYDNGVNLYFTNGSNIRKVLITNDSNSNLKLAGNLILASNTNKIQLGSTQQSSIYYNNSDLLINPKDTGSGKVYILGGEKISGNISSYNTIDTAGMGVPPIVYYAGLTGKISTISNTTMTSTAGLYRISSVLECVTPNAATMGIELKWTATEDSGSVTQTMGLISCNSGAGAIRSSTVIQATSNVSYQTIITGSPAATYEVHIVLERLA